ncbi:MAG TPA: DNA polymerase/3'-5' exonuclease PolX [Nitrososphaerales archaeon]|nr:DNA polymerase/3'-5' exonuclease PolX [Nitrososphaerales archaeon]
MKNLEVADLLDRLGTLVEANGEDRFKVIAYHRAATSVRNMKEDVAELWEAGKLEDIQYVGSGIAKKIDEYLRTGRLRILDDLQAKIPPGVPELMNVTGIGPRTAHKLSHEYGVKSVQELKEAIDRGVLDGEFGPTVKSSILAGIARLQSYKTRMLLPEAEGVFERLTAYYSGLGIPIAMAGSLRRGKETVGDLDLLSTDPRATGALEKYPGATQKLESGPRRASVKLESGVQVDVRYFREDESGAAMVYFTGSKDHNIALRTLAMEKGWKLNEYGLFDAKGGGRLAGRTEEEIYAKLGLSYVAPELRENRGEVEAAKKDELPRLIRSDQVRGDLQMHSTWSDGVDELEAMARAASERGYDYVAITDHSQAVRVANGLTEERFRRQWKEIDKLNSGLKPFRIIRAVELEIRADGSLDFDNRFLDEFELVGASLHQSFRQSADKLTARVVGALSNPSVDFLCHPTNRLLGRREGNPIELKKVIEAAKDNGKALEIDGEPDRLDMDEVWARKAMEEGVKLLVDSDAHSTGQLDNIEYGITVARRAWLEPKNVLNTQTLKNVLEFAA